MIAQKTKPIPAGFHTVTPFLTAKGCDRLIEFLERAFGAQELLRVPHEDGTIMHAQVRIGDSVLMLSEACGGKEPIPAMMWLYVEDADAVYRHALKAGATTVAEPQDQFFGDRAAGVKDWFGNHWWMATHLEDVPDEELKRRAAAQEHTAV
jgi:PhnB protein